MTQQELLTLAQNTHPEDDAAAKAIQDLINYLTLHSMSAEQIAIWSAWIASGCCPTMIPALMFEEG